MTTSTATTAALSTFRVMYRDDAGRLWAHIVDAESAEAAVQDMYNSDRHADYYESVERV